MMLHRYPHLRAYMWPEWLKWFALPDNDMAGIRRAMAQSVAEAKLWQGTKDSLDVLLGNAIMPTVTLEGQRRKI